MIRLVRTAAAAALAALVILAGGVAAPSPAAASDEVIGWLRFTPAQGSVTDAIEALSQATCPGGEAVVLTVSGRGIGTGNDVGNMVGNTKLSALPPTTTGQLYVPFSLTLRDYFARNAPGVRPSGTYTFRLVCRDALRSEPSYGVFVGQISIAKNGTYRALGESAKPFDAQKKSTDPLAGGTLPSASPSGGATASPTPSASAAPSSSATPAPTAGTSTAPLASATPSVVAEPVPVADAGASGPRLLLLALGAVVLAALAIAGVRSRRRIVGPDVTEPVEPTRHSVDSR